MSEDVKPDSDILFEDRDGFHGRILKIMGSLTLVGAVVTALAVSPRFGFGFLIGGLFSLVNYYWIKKITRKFFERAVKGESLVSMGARFALRYFLLGAVILFVYLTGILPVIAVLFGLSSFAVAVVFEGIFSIFSPVKV